MKNLGKKNVFFETYLDGKLEKSWKENRNVYQNKEDKKFINYMTGKKEIFLIPESNSEYLCKIESATIHNIMNGTQFLEHIKNNFLNNK